MSGSSPWSTNRPVCLTGLIEGIRAGNVRDISRAITIIESDRPEGRTIREALGGPSGSSMIVGMTGYPGAGKSTLIDQLSTIYRTDGKKVGILATDVSSSLTGGAILGDRIRMQSHASDEGIFIRSMATRGHRGGLAKATGDAIRILEVASYDVIFVETVGVGQEEGEIINLAQVLVMVVAPGLGDDIQAMKAGLLEMAHIVVVNKADRSDAQATVQALRDWVAQVIPTTARSGEGLSTLAKAIAAMQVKAASGPDAYHTAQQTH